MKLDIAVAGCGIGGLAAALLLQRDGHRVVMFERFEQARPVGSGLMLQPTGLAVLDRLGLGQAVRHAGARIDRLFGKVGGGRDGERRNDDGRTVLDVRYAALGASAGHGIGIHRASLFAALHDATLAAAIPVVTGRTITGSHVAGSKRRLEFSDSSSSGAFDLIVDALGAQTPLAPAAGNVLDYGALWASLDWPGGTVFDPAALEQRYIRASTMAGVLPIGTPPGATRPQAAFFWSMRRDRLADWHAAGLAMWKADVGALWPACAPLLDQIDDAGQLTFARYTHRTLARPGEAALIHIGDAWHSASPQLGQGANMALLDAWALAAALRTAPDVGSAIGAAIALRRRHVRLYQWLSHVFTPFYQSDSRVKPLLRDRLVGPLSSLWPAPAIQAAMVSGLIGSPLKALRLDRDAALVSAVLDSDAA